MTLVLIQKERSKNSVMYQHRRQLVITAARAYGNELLKKYKASCWDSRAEATKDSKITMFLGSKRFLLLLRTFCMPLQC